MSDKKRRIPPSLSAFTENLAKQLRSVVKASSLKDREIKEQNGLSNTNKIKQIALMLRSEVKKLGPSKRKKH